MKTLGINRISPSMLMEYESCPKLFYYRSWLGLKLPQPQVHFKFGDAIHAAIGNIYDQMDKKTKWKLAEMKIAKNLFLKMFTLECLDRDLYGSEEERVAKFEEMRDDGVAIIKTFWDRKEEMLIQHRINPMQFEIGGKVPIKNLSTGKELEVPISFRLDAVNDSEEHIIELKTSKAKYDEQETRNSLQALSYVTVKFFETGKVYKLTYVVMLKGRKSEDRIQILPYTYDEADIMSFIAKVEITLEKIRNREFDRPAMGHQNWCDCYRFEEALDVSDLITKK